MLRYQKQFVQVVLLVSLLFIVQLSHANLIQERVVTKTLVLLDDWAIKETHSKFFEILKYTLGHKLQFAMITEAPQTEGRASYDKYYFKDQVVKETTSGESVESEEGITKLHWNIILMAPSVKGKFFLFLIFFHGKFSKKF